MSIAGRGAGARKGGARASFATSAIVRRRMQAVRRRDTPGELALRAELHSRGLRYRVDARPAANLRSRADIVFSRARVAVFVDGCFWHGCERHQRLPAGPNQAWWRAKLASTGRRDAETSRRLRSEGWLVMRAWTHESMEHFAATIEIAVRLRLWHQAA